ncbi:MAG: aminopeptidase P family protein [Verrucomicrobiota bacterium]|nr:MAG: aminopeptidase P family protein [Verrucomicrobiota bacterium]
MAIRLIYATPATNANLLYWGHFFTTDAFLAFEVEGQRYAVANELEFAAMREQSAFDGVLLPKDLVPEGEPKLINLIAAISERYPDETLLLPKNFPAALLLKIQKEELPYAIAEDEFLPERTTKTAEECDQIREACRVTALAFERAKMMLSLAEVTNDDLWLDGEYLTSERVRHEIENVCFQNGALAQETIVACGRSAACPHFRGSGRIRANEFVVIDIFPRLRESGYYGDMTRTFLKGQPTETQKAVYDAVQMVHDRTIEALKVGVKAASIHEKNIALFENLGYETTDNMGFFHATGHGVGLELHEAPGIGKQNVELKEGMVVTVEPGLYYPDIGGVRIEDVVVIRESSAELLSNFPYDWIL